MSKVKVRLNQEGVDRLQGAEVFWQSYAAMNKCLEDARKKEAFIAGYITGWDRNERPPLPGENIVLVDF